MQNIMSAGIPLGGEDRPLTERLPNGYFKELSTCIWQVGSLALGQLIEKPMAPSTINATPVRVGQLAVELLFEFRLNGATDMAEPVRYKAVLSEIEPYQQIEDAELWSWRQFDLDVRRRRKDFSRGTSVVTEYGEIELTAAPPIGHRRSAGPAAWRQVAHLDTQCTNDDYYWFMDRLATIQHSLQTQE